MNQAADVADDVLRLSMDAKATVKIGPFARGGKSRVAVAAVDHDFAPDATLTPVGIFLPTTDELFLYGVTSKVTSDCLVDRLVQWWDTVRERYAPITTLVLNLDNGPENHSRRTQFMQRLVEFVQQYHLNIRLAYYPPYHSKYNPIERCWGILENHWNGALLDSIDAALQFTRTMTWKGAHPVVARVTTTYQTGVKLTKEALNRKRSRGKLIENQWVNFLGFALDYTKYLILQDFPF
jgi:transposase